MLCVAWAGAGIGIAFRLLWPAAPRWLYTPIYIALGWMAIFFVGDFARNADTAVLVLIAGGGLLYTAGGVVYGLRRPEPAASLVRVPRGLPHADRARLRRALRGCDDSDVLLAVTVTAQMTWNSRARDVAHGEPRSGLW